MSGPIIEIVHRGGFVEQAGLVDDGNVLGPPFRFVGHGTCGGEGVGVVLILVIVAASAVVDGSGHVGRAVRILGRDVTGVVLRLS